MNYPILTATTRRTLICLALALPWAAHAEAWPAKPIRVIVPTMPASPPDAVIRSIEDLLAKELGKPIVVENKAGAQGAIALEMLAKSAPDGYTFGLINVQSVAAAALRKQTPYDINKSFAPVSQLTAENPVLIVNAKKVPARNLKELVELLKTKSDTMTYASAGSGSPSHLGMELFKREIGSKVLHVPYRGAGPASVDVAGGQADLALVGSNVATQLIKGGRVRALAVSADHRLPSLPDVPTMAELGYKQLDLRGWVGLVAPAGTDPTIIAKMQDAVQKSLASEQVQSRFANVGSTPKSSSPTEFGRFIASEATRWQKVVKDASIKFE